MRVCQVCGCASWGPIGNPSELERVLPWKLSEAWTFVRCDNCNAIAREDLLQEDSRSTNSTEKPDAGFDLSSIMQPMMAAVLPSVPTPPTRTERLTQTLVRRAQKLDIHDNQLAVEIVRFARQLETALDHPNGPATTEVTANTPWLVLSFPAREEFERWLTGFLDTVVYSTSIIKPEYSPFLYDRAVSYVQQ